MRCFWNIFAFCLLATSMALAQQTAGSAPATMTFEVASVRHSIPKDSFAVSGGFSGRTTHLAVMNFDLGNLLQIAYGDHPFFRIEGIPDSFRWVVFDVSAHADPNDEARFEALSPSQQHAERQHMLQTLLADRFHLRTHWELRDGQVIRLTAPHGESKLHASAGSASPDRTQIRQQSDPRGGFDLIGDHCTMAQLTEMLRSQFGTTVEDATGLVGAYDFVLPYLPEGMENDSDPNKPLPLSRALDETLGLKTEKVRGKAEFLVADHAEMPTEN